MGGTRPGPDFAQRVGAIAPFQVMQILEHAQQMERAGRSVVHMEVGEPDFDTPPAVVEAGCRALQAGATKYSPSAGLPDLRAALSAHYAADFGVQVPAERIFITPGASGALLLASALLLEPGREALITDPGYPCNRNFIEVFGARAKLVAVGPAERYQMTAAGVRRHCGPDTRAVWAASPANPTGTTLTPAGLAELVRACDDHGLALVMDEIYQGLVYGVGPSSVLAHTDAAYVVGSFSKYFGMTGWRLGWIVAPEAAIDALERLSQNLFIAASTPAQVAALAAFAPETRTELEARREQFGVRRRLLLDGLRALGFDVEVEPEGAFYVYAGIARFGLDSASFCDRLLAEQGVAATPGTDFGGHRADAFVRFSYTTSTAAIERGLECIGRFVATLAMSQ